MTDISAIERRAEPALTLSAAEVADFLALMKPRVMSLYLFALFAGLLLDRALVG
jgi:heme O synthase-like polyprenyltransferase